MERLSCQVCHSPRFLNPLYDNRLCVFCIIRGVERAAGQAVQAVLATEPDRDGLMRAAMQFAMHNTLLVEASTRRPPASPDTPLGVQVDAQREEFRKHINWCQQITKDANHVGVLLELLTITIQMRRLFRRYLQRPGAPRSWTELERRAPGASIVWLTWAEVWCAGYLAIGSPYVYEARAVVEQMCGALQKIPPLLIGARTDLHNDAEVIMLSGWAATQLSTRRNKRLMNALADRPADTRWYEELCDRLPGSVVSAWRAGDWHTARDLRNRIAGDLERGGTAPKKRGRPQKAITPVHDQARALAAEQARPVEDAYELAERRQELDRLAEKLTPKEKYVFWHHRLDGESLAEIAHALGIKQSYAKKLSHLARKKLKQGAS